MTGKLFVATATAVLLTFVQQAGAKPLTYVGRGCEVTALVQATSDTYFAQTQTFRPTFSVLKKAKLVLFQAPPSDEDVVFWARVSTADGTFVGDSSDSVVEAGTSFLDAQAGDAIVTFSFGGGIAVTPGETYRLELLWKSGGTQISICVAPDFYSDGAWMVGPNMQAGYDLEFAVTGGGKPH